MSRVNEGKFVCDVCKQEFDMYPYPPQTVIVRGNTIENVIPDMCSICQNSVSNFIDTLKK